MLSSRASEARLTRPVGVVKVEKREVVSVRVSELSLSLVGLLALTVGTEVGVGDCERGEGGQTCCWKTNGRQESSPESMAAILRISFEHLNSGETMSILAS